MQRRFTWLFDDLRSREYQDRLKVLKLWSLEERRHRSDLIELFKMARGLSAIPLTDFFNFSTRPFGSTTHGHSWKLITAHSNTDIRLYFFSSRVLNRWNSLPQEAVSSSTVNIFKGHLERTRSVNMGFFHVPLVHLTLMLLCASTYTTWLLWLLHPVHELHGPHLIWSYIGAANLVRYLVRNMPYNNAQCFILPILLLLCTVLGSDRRSDCNALINW